LSPTHYSHRWQWETADRRGLRPGNRSRTARRATSQTVARAVASFFVVLTGYVAARSLPHLL